MTRLSNSGKDKFLQCAHKWYIHYILRLRGATLGSPLFFGSALDDAWGHLLLAKKIDRTFEETILLETVTAERMFLDKMYLNEHNGENKVLSLDLSVRYSNADVDLSLLTEDDYEALRSLDDGIEDWAVFWEECKQIKRNKQELCDEDQRLLNFLSWLSLLNKGLMLIETYREEIMPQIHKVHSIQEEVTLPDEDDNVITGWIDFTASFVDDPDTIYVCDNKTASKAYTADSVATSEQLATYCEYKDTNKGAYVVGEKNIRKRDPRVRINIIKDEIPEEQFEDTFELYEEVLASIEAEDFPKNMDNDKSCFFFGQTCEYYNLCKHGNKADLVDMNKVDKANSMVEKKFGVDFKSDGGALTLQASYVTDTDNTGEFKKIHDDGWTIKGTVVEDYYTWVNSFEAEHPEYGKVWGDFEDTVYADSEQAYQVFYEKYPPEAWDYWDI